MRRRRALVRRLCKTEGTAFGWDGAKVTWGSGNGWCGEGVLREGGVARRMSPQGAVFGSIGQKVAWGPGGATSAFSL